jgi:hypothetical protein
MCAMKILVIGSCTQAKDIRNYPSLLTQADFNDPFAFQRREAELSAWALPAETAITLPFR